MLLQNLRASCMFLTYYLYPPAYLSSQLRPKRYKQILLCSKTQNLSLHRTAIPTLWISKLRLSTIKYKECHGQGNNQHPADPHLGVLSTNRLQQTGLNTPTLVLTSYPKSQPVTLGPLESLSVSFFNRRVILPIFSKGRWS